MFSTKLADDSQSKQDGAETFLGDVTIATEQAHAGKTEKIKAAHQQHKDDVRNKVGHN
jgi:ribosomal protein L21